MVFKVWIATQTWVATGQERGRAKVIQIRENDFLQDKNFYNLQIFFPLIKF